MNFEPFRTFLPNPNFKPSKSPNFRTVFHPTLRCTTHIIDCTIFLFSAHCDSGSSHVLKPGVDDRLHHPLFKKNSTIITCTHHKGMRCAQMTLTRHYSLSSLLEALPAASVDAEADLEKHASISSLSSGSRYSDYDGYFYI